MKVVFLLFSLICAITAQHDHHDEKDWWENAVFYQVYPRSFKDSIGNDGIGDIRGIIDKLDHLVDLGVDGFWMNPVFLSPMKDFGYDIQDFYSIQAEYGTEADLTELFRLAKEKGLKVIMDFVPNHTSDQHEWFVKSAAREVGFEDYYVWHNGNMDGVPEGQQPNVPNNWRSVFHQGAWTWNEQREQYYLHQFAIEQPDLNFRHLAVEEELRKIINYWLDKGADGFRIDAINHSFEVEDFADEPLIDPQGDPTLYSNLLHISTMDLQENYDMVYGWRQMMDLYSMTDNVTRLLMTEAYANISSTMQWYNDNGRQISHIPFNFMMISNLDGESTANDFKTAIDTWYTNMPVGSNANWVLGNHDRPRIAQRYGNDRVDGMAILSLLLPGISFIYYGEDIGMEDNRDITWDQSKDPQGCNTNESVFMLYTRDPVRTPMQWDATTNAGFSIAAETWLPVHANYQTLNVAAQKIAAKSTFKMYQELIQLRKGYTFSHGEFKSSVTQTSVFTYLRHLDDHDSYAIVVNMGSVSRTINLSQVFSELTKTGTVVLASGKSTYSVGSDLTPETIVLAGFEAIVIEFKNGAGIVTMSVALLCLSILKALF